MAPERGIPWVVSAPSGTGKTTICRAVVERDPRVVHSVSHTTREPRAGEVDGVHYHFVDASEFDRLVQQGAFLEWAQYGDNLYGTSLEALDASLDQGLDVLLEIEVQGAAQVRERRRDARLLFLLPPSWAELEKRLRGRGTDSEKAVQKRLTIARRELEAVQGFDYVVVNDALEEAIATVRTILAGEREGRGEALRLRHGRGPVMERMAPRFEDAR
jgi:guanylate kinase